MTQPSLTAKARWLNEARVRKPFQLLLAVLLFVGLLGGGTQWWASRLSEQRAQAQTMRDQAESLAVAATEEKIQLQSFQLRYFELRKQGFVGDEQRLAWIETLQLIRAKRRLTPFEYTLEPRAELAIAPEVEAGEVRLHASLLKLRMPLLHEMDLVNLLRDLENHVMYVPYQCSLSRKEGNADKTTPQLNAECGLYIPTAALPALERPEDQL